MRLRGVRNLSFVVLVCVLIYSKQATPAACGAEYGPWGTSYNGAVYNETSLCMEMIEEYCVPLCEENGGVDYDAPENGTFCDGTFTGPNPAGYYSSSNYTISCTCNDSGPCIGR